MRLLISYGTRPEWIKLCPVIEEIRGKIPFKILFTGQHTDLVPEASIDYFIEIKKLRDRQESIVNSILTCNPVIFEDISHVLVQGDTTSSFAVALAAFYKGKFVIHLEAGGRTYDTRSPFPEEFNRQVISSIADIHFCITEGDRRNLVREKSQGAKFVVGDTVLDHLRSVTPEYGNRILVTLHRHENQMLIPQWFMAISNLAKRYKQFEFVLPIHPNPAIYAHKDLLKRVNVCKAMDHKDLIAVLAESRLVISDSGGIMDEACFLNKKVIIPRKIVETEKAQSLGIHFFLCQEPKELGPLFDTLIEEYQVEAPCPYGDGFAAKRIAQILTEIAS